VNIQIIFLWLNAGMEMSAPMVNDILNYALFHSSPCINQAPVSEMTYTVSSGTLNPGIPYHTNQTLHQILHVLHFCTLDSLLNYDPDFL